MKKFTCVLVALILLLTLGLSACSSSAIAEYRTAVMNGYTGTFDDWVASQTQNSNNTQYTLDELYQLAVQSGYDGTYAEWLSCYNANSDNDTAETVEEATAKALRSVVCIQSMYRTTSGSSFGSAGSGVIFYEDDYYAYIITNYHVIYDSEANPNISKDITVYLYGMYYENFGIGASYVAGSMSNDIAVIKIPKNERYLNSASCVADVADSLTVSAGDAAIAIGNPGADGLSVTSGIISMESENIELTAPDEVSLLELRVFRIDTPVNPGNSGGGLFNSDGELIGIVNAKYIDSETESVGYAIPSNIAVSLAKRLLEDGGTTTDKVVFGITMKVTESNTVYDQATGKLYVVQDITVDEIARGSAAEGYLQVGDIIKSFTYNGKTVNVTKLYTIGDYIFTFKQSSVITFTVMRDGVETQVNMPMVNVVPVP